MEITIYTDGAAKGNPGPGGYGAVLMAGKFHKEISEGFRLTTNNRMELTAAIEGLRALKERCEVEVVTDSEYVKNGITTWIHGWKRNGWRRREGKQLKPLKNEEHWRKLDALLSRHRIRFTVVRGHTGHPENERCDVLAVAAAELFK